MKRFMFFLAFVCATMFFSCQKDETNLLPIEPAPQPTVYSLFNIPGIIVVDDAIYGKYLCIDSIKTLHILETILQNQPDHIRQAWESTIGFYSRETITQNRMKLLIDSMKVLERDMESNDELYHELWLEYRQLQYTKEMTAEMDKFVNEQGYVKFRGEMWRIVDDISYLVLPGGNNVPHSTFRYNSTSACHKSKIRKYELEHYEDHDSTYYLSCFDRKFEAWLINYESVWGYHYCKIVLEDDYMVCPNGRWLPLVSTFLRANIRINYEQGANTYSMGGDKKENRRASRLSYMIAHGSSAICIQSADIEFSAYNEFLSPRKLESTLVF